VFLKIHEPISFSDLETVGEYDLKLIASTKEDPQDLKDVLKKNSAKSIIYMVGPEGGFTPNEIVQAQENGFTQIRFGSNIMRSETAAIFLGSVIKYELG
jgi:16S rRNA (uracil1498-N3)-methyltransferase